MIRVRAVEAARRFCGYQFPRFGGAAFAGMRALLPRRVDVELVRGIRATLDLNDGTQAATYWQGARFEQPTAETLSRAVAHGATTFFDIGANYGFFTFLLLSRFPSLRVHAFEPNPATFRLLHDIKDRNSLAQLSAWNIALSDQPGRLPLLTDEHDSGHATLGTHPGLHSLAGEVDVVAFDSWRRTAELELPTTACWVAKLDVEGFEPRVLRGMSESLAARAFRLLVIEINAFALQFCGTSAAEIFSLLENHGYRQAVNVQASRASGNAFFEPAS